MKRIVYDPFLDFKSLVKENNREYVQILLNFNAKSIFTKYNVHAVVLWLKGQI